MTSSSKSTSLRRPTQRGCSVAWPRRNCSLGFPSSVSLLGCAWASPRTGRPDPVRDPTSGPLPPSFLAVLSSFDDREMVGKCLSLGAIDYLVKPLRHNELRHIWTRMWWWRRMAAAALSSGGGPLVRSELFPASSEESKDTKWCGT
jgi:hypothetical protein